MVIVEMNGDYYCIVSSEFKFDTFRESFLFSSKTKKNSLAYKYLDCFYKAMFTNSINLNSYYRKYYFEEYETFEKFLYEKENLGNGQISRIMLEPNKTIMKLKISLNNYNFDSLVEHSETFLKAFNQMIEELDI